jgi:hypothetical protein
MEKKKCSGCPKKIPIDSEYATCDTCQERAAKYRARQRENVVKCSGTTQKGTECTYKVSPKYGNKYCEKHKVLWQATEDGKDIRRCTARTKCGTEDGLKAILPDDCPFAHCDNCREHDRIKTQNRKENVEKKNKKLISNGSNKRLCKKCPIGANMHDISEMGIKADGSVSIKCKIHFEEDKIKEVNRLPREDRTESYKKYEAKPERKAAKKQWSKDHPDKVYEYYTSFRARKLNEDPATYREKQAEYARNWRDKHPEEMKELNEEKRYNVNIAYSFYRYCANEKNYNFKLTIDEFKDIIKQRCYYCNHFEVNRLMGIDRTDSSIGYSKDNIVPCCKTCNMMKNTLNKETFILMCVHITTKNMILNHGLFPEVFNNHYNKNYCEYMNRALHKKNIEFELTKKEFNRISNLPCYVCGKEPNDNHVNGIDRIDNDIGYTGENSLPCCGDCNYLKKDLNHDIFLYKCAFICSTHKNNIRELKKNWEPSKFLTRNDVKERLSSERKVEKKKVKDDIRHSKTMSSKTPEAIAEKKAEIKKKMDNMKGIFELDESITIEKPKKKKKKQTVIEI